MKNVDLNATSLHYSTPIWPRVIVVGVAWAIVYALTRLRISSYKHIVIVNLYFATVLFTLLVFVCILAQGGSKALELYSITDWSSLFHLEASVFLFANVAPTLSFLRG